MATVDEADQWTVMEEEDLSLILPTKGAVAQPMGTSRCCRWQQAIAAINADNGKSHAKNQHSSTRAHLSPTSRFPSAFEFWMGFEKTGG